MNELEFAGELYDCVSQYYGMRLEKGELVAQVKSLLKMVVE